MAYLKKFVLKPNEKEDCFFIYNIIFRTCHSLMRKNEIKILFGFKSPESFLIIYAFYDEFQKIINDDSIKKLYQSSAFYYEECEVKDNEPYLSRVNHVSNVRKKTEKQKSFLHKKGIKKEDIDKHLNRMKEEYENKKKNSIYFLAYKNNKKIPIFCEIKHGSVFNLKSNSYGVA